MVHNYLVIPQDVFPNGLLPNINWLKYLQRNYCLLLPTLISWSQNGSFNLDPPVTEGASLDAVEEDILICISYLQISKRTLNTIKQQKMNKIIKNDYFKPFKLILSYGG